jgi:hypothetical protein
VAPTYNTHALVWDYTEGDTASQAKFSLQYFHINPGAQCVVQNQTTKRLEMWYGSAAAGDVYREMNGSDAVPFRDGTSSGIDSRYETALMPGSPGRDSFTYRHQGAFFRVLGSGVLPITAYTLDHAQSKTLSPITLSSSPGREYWEACGLISECKSYLLTNSATADYWFQISRLQDFVSIYSKNRGGIR